jgi:hypothetical protein
MRSSVRLYEEDEDHERCQRGVGAGEEFEGACKRRHGGGSDLNFYLLLAQLSSSSLLSPPISLCLLPLSLSTQPEMKGEEMERECFSPFSFFLLHLVPCLGALLTELSLRPALSITA